MSPILDRIHEALLAVVAHISATSRLLRSLANVEVHSKLRLRRKLLSTILALMNRSCGSRDSIVPESMTTTNDFALAPAPLRATQIAELSTAIASYVIATDLFFNHVATLKAPHPLHLSAKLSNGIGKL